jgi:hypothetical protein
LTHEGASGALEMKGRSWLVGQLVQHARLRNHSLSHGEARFKAQAVVDLLARDAEDDEVAQEGRRVMAWGMSPLDALGRMRQQGVRAGPTDLVRHGFLRQRLVAEYRRWFTEQVVGALQRRALRQVGHLSASGRRRVTASSVASPRESCGGPRRATAKPGASGGDDPPQPGDDDSPFGQPSGGGARRQGNESRKSRARALNSALALLASRLSDGLWHPSVEVTQDLDGLVNLRTLRRARVALGVEVGREGFGPGGRWLWRLPVDTLSTMVAGFSIETPAQPGESAEDHAARHRQWVLFIVARERLRQGAASRCAPELAQLCEQRAAAA